MNFSLISLLNSIENFNNGIAFDVGCHHGEYSSFLLQSGHFKQVIAFEPNMECYQNLITNSHKYPDLEFKIVNIALSNDSGMMQFFCDEDTATGSLLPYDVKYKNNGILRQYSVPVTTLDLYLRENPISEKLRFLKIDTQGNDLAVIQGAIETITNFRPIIQTEFIYIPLYKSQCSVDELQNKLNLLKYKLYSLNNIHVTKQGCLAFCDAIFIPEELTVAITPEYKCLDNSESYVEQIRILQNICKERLDLINKLDLDLKNCLGRH